MKTLVCSNVSKTFRLPHDRPSTLKQRVLHPRQSRAATTLHALSGVSFDVDQGEFFGVIGRNGSGKSSLLKCVAGIYEPTRGTIDVAGRISPFIELGVGFNARYDNQPLPDKEKLDTTSTLSLVYAYSSIVK